MHILLRASWQTINIGDVAHAPATAQALRAADPTVRIVLWPHDIGDREREMFARLLPDTRIVDGQIGEDGVPTTPVLAEQFASADVLIHGSGPGLVGRNELRAWHEATGKPYGFFGVTVDPFQWTQEDDLATLASMIDALPACHLPADTKELLDGAAFLFTREKLSLNYLRGQEVRTPVLDFGPDSTYVADIADSAAAQRIVEEYRLEDGRFACVVPRSRYTPYHRLRGFTPNREHLRRQAVSAAHEAADMAVLRDAIVHYVRRTGHRVLIVPEMSYQVELARKRLADGYPADVADRVDVLPRFWSLPEAAGLYRRMDLLVSQDCHSPILAAAAGVPALYVRQPTDTIKGQMYPDIGADHVEIGEGAAPVLRWIDTVIDEPDAARARTTAAAEGARKAIMDAARTALECVQP